LIGINARRIKLHKNNLYLDRQEVSMSVKSMIVRRGVFLAAVAALAGGMTINASPSWAYPCKIVAQGPVNQGVVFYGVKCNYVACYCVRRICAGHPPQTWCKKLEMKMHP
jgi:hypothetical protein